MANLEDIAYTLPLDAVRGDCIPNPGWLALRGPLDLISSTCMSVLDGKLATYLRSYLDARRAGAVQQEEDALRWTCSALARLLGYLLEESNGWTGLYWVDDVLPGSVDVLSKVEL